MQKMNKQKALDQIAKEIEQCAECKVGKGGKAVPGEGNPDADIVFIGEAPGKNEAIVGRPFIGRSGKLLRTLIQEAGLKEEDIFITSPVKYLPDRGTPTPDDIKHGKIHLDKQLDVIEPKFIVLLGSVASKALLESKVFVAKDHGRLFERNGRTYFLTYHPAAALRFQKNKPFLVEDFKKLNKLLERVK